MPLHTLGFVGAGNMAEALVRAVLKARLLTPDRLMVSDPSEARRKMFRDEIGIRAVANNADVAKECKTLLLSVKPQIMDTVAAELRPLVTEDHVLISIMAGLSTQRIEAAFGAGRKLRVIRTMPNLPVQVGYGMTGIAAGQHATQNDLDQATAIFDAAGSSLVISEDKLHAVTAVSGSGPAYFFYFVEAMIRGGVQCGLTEAEASHLARQTALGAARMMIESNEPPAVLRQRVTSKGGTTEAAIAKDEELHVGESIAKGVVAASDRSKQLGVG